jgi:uncharacterized protein
VPTLFAFLTWRRAVVILAILAFTAVAGVVFLLWRESVLLTNPPGYTHPRAADFRFEATPLSLHGVDFEDIEVAAPGGDRIRGWLVPATDKSQALAVVAVHGRGGDRTNHLPHLPLLREAGAAVALIDLRENGLSDGRGRGTALAMREAEDALAVAADLRRRGYRKIVLFGCSLGGSAALIAGAKDPEIAGVIAESPIASFAAYVRDYTDAKLRGRGLSAGGIASVWGQMVVGMTRVRLGLDRLDSPVDVIANINPRPVLIIHGTDDAVVSATHAQDLAKRAGTGAVFATIPGGGHCNSFDILPGEFSDQVRKLLASALSS